MGQPSHCLVIQLVDKCSLKDAAPELGHSLEVLKSNLDFLS